MQERSKKRRSKKEREGAERDPLAVELGRRGGLRGGPARAARLSAERRSEIAARAARARWASPHREARPRPTRARGERTRRAILDLAQERLIQGGSENIRLKDLAAGAGCSHATILHHFGSRAGLMEALARRAIADLWDELIGLVQAGATSPANRIQRTKAILERGMGVFEGRGFARLIAGLILARRESWKDGEKAFEPYARAVHRARVERRDRQGLAVPTLEDSLHEWLFLGVVFFGYPLFAPILRRGLGLPEGPETDDRFRTWLAHQIEASEPVFREGGEG